MWAEKAIPVLLSPHPGGFAEENESAEEDSTFVGGMLSSKPTRYHEMHL